VKISVITPRRQQQKINFVRRKIVVGILVVATIFTFGLGTSRPASAQVGIPVVDELVALILETGVTIREIGDEARDTVKLSWNELIQQLKRAAAISVRQGVRFFLTKLATDTSTWIASGAKGQGPLFITQGWGDYLKDAADGAAGVILDNLTRSTTYEQRAGSCECSASDGSSFSKSAANEAECTGLESSPDVQCTWTPPGKAVKEAGGLLEGFNICAPDLDVQLRITLGLTPTGLGRPKCRFSTLKRNWEREITKASFLPDFQRTFNPEENDLGVALGLHTNLLAQQEQARLEAVMARSEGKGFKPLTEKISEAINLPAEGVRNIFGSTLDVSFGGELFPTGDIIADAVSAFTNTLATQFLNNLIKNGLGGGDYGPSGRRARGTATLTNPEAEVRVEGVNAARIRLVKDIDPSFSTPGRYDVLSLLVSCANPSKHGPNDCAITDNMRNAISQKMTVKQAVEKGLFNATGPFGFSSWDPQPIEPSLTDGIPYRSILLMRKYRIVPVGWELAAKYIQYFDKKPHSLSELIKTGGCDGGGVYDCKDSPFYHFIDPDWVLSAPDAFCKLQGPGPEIISSQVSQGSDLNKDGKYDGPDEEPPSVQVTRNENYCADEQTCIQKDSKGVCKFYGYCTEEKRVWNFGENSCQPEFNTCATLANKTTGETVSYLLNTVDFDSCDAKSVGCKQYSRNQEANGLWSSTAYPDSIHLNAQAKSCDAENAGCRAYIRTGFGLPAGDVVGVNLLPNGSFEALDSTNTNQPLGWSITHGSLQLGDARDGQRFYRSDEADAIVNVSSDLIIPLNKDGLYALSFWARGSNGGVPSVYYNSSDGGGGQLRLLSDLTLTGEWQKYIVAIQLGQLNPLLQKLLIKIPANSDLDAVKLEVGDQATGYSNYGSGVTAASHLKRPPDYLGCLSDPDSSACQPYARYCKAEEVGCLRYTPTPSGAPITSVRGDVCPNECVGYDTYTQSKTFFESARFQDLIPKTANKCSAAAVGCDEFTNLDIEKQGGEAKEYYQNLRFCQKPTGGTDEGIFYTWEGSDTTGFQLKVFQLKKTNAATEPWAPCVSLDWTGSNTAICADTTSSRLVSGTCLSTDLGSNPDCRQFYDPDGNISYRLLSRTISISNDCRPYRKTSSTQSDCATSSGYWNSAASACLYQAIPKEGRRCSAAAAGCREYRGGTSANYRTIFNDTFESGTGGWANGSLSPVSSVVGGHSYKLQLAGSSLLKSLSLTQGNLVTETSYIMSFWARSQEDSATISGSFVPAVGNPIAFSASGEGWTLSTDWTPRHSDPFTISKGSEGYLTLSVTGDDAYIDNIELKSNVNTYYLIKNSWNTPGSCLAPEQMLGCQAFKVSDGKTRNIWRFGPSCNDKVVGCEELVDTQNTTMGDSAPFEQSFDLDRVGDNELKIPADTIDYIVNDPSKQCRSEFQGCEALGAPGQRVDAASPTHLRNNPDQYEQNGEILCRSEQQNCAAYTTSKNTEIYFKDPGNNVCRYLANRQYPGWYRDVCSNDADESCTTAADCKDNGVPVPGAICGPPLSNSQPNCQNPSTGMPRTLASGVKEPKDKRVGLCPAEQNSCTEFIDPRSDSERNIIYNGSFLDLDGNGEPDVWENDDPPDPPFIGYDSPGGIKVSQKNGNGLRQEVDLEGRQLYILTAEVQAGTAAVPAMIGLRDCTGVMPSLDGLQSSMVDVTYKSAGGDGVAALITPKTGSFTRFSGQFYMTGDAKCNVVLGTADMLSSPSSSGTPGYHIFKNISLRKAIIDYQLADRVDRKSCAGVVDNNTCVLFNERAVDSGRSVQAGGTITYRSLTSDADTSPTDAKIANSLTDITCNNGTCSNFISRSCVSNQDCALPFDSNAIIKVSPDRECASWLSCRTARTVTANGVTKNICLDVQNCEEMDPNTGFCLKQVLSDAPDSDLTYKPGNVDLLKNRSGYSHVGFDWSHCSITVTQSCRQNSNCPAGETCINQVLQGYMSPAFMSQIDGEVTVYNGNFEIANSVGKPSGWEGWRNGENFRVIDDPLAAQKAGVTYPMEERKFLEVNANNTAPADDKTYVSYDIPVTPATAYVISAYLNTLHFTGKRVEVRVYEYPGPTDFGPYNATLNLPPGLDWTLATDYFKTKNNTQSIKIQLAWNASGKCTTGGAQCDSNSACGLINGPCIFPPVGLWYIDDVKIQPALQYQKNEHPFDTPDFPDKSSYEYGLVTNDYHYAPQSCRLYPEPDALSCRYYDDKGLRQRGKLGYCLEWDPQNSNYCLQWWPVDSVTGEDTNEDRAGYNDRAPLYYCLDTSDNWLPTYDPYSGATGSEEVKNFQCANVKGELTECKFVKNEEYSPKGYLLLDGASSFNIYNSDVGDPGHHVVYGLVDKPGDCDVHDGGQGCEIRIGVEVHDSTDGYTLKVKNEAGQTYQIGSWREGDPNGSSPPGPPSEDAGKGNIINMVRYYDLADAIDQDGNPIKLSGTYRYIIIDELTSSSVYIHSLWFRPNYSCNYIIQTVTSTGENKAYASRLAQGSNYSASVQGGLSGGPYLYSRSADLTPFGAAVPPEPVDTPSEWDAKSFIGIQPLFPEPPLSDGTIGQARAGVPYSCQPQNFLDPSSQPQQCSSYLSKIGIDTQQGAINVIQNLFVQSYGIWQWQGDQYVPTTSLTGLKEPSTQCGSSSPDYPPPLNVRPTSADAKPCGVAPQVPEIRINNSTSSVTLNRIGTVTLSFTTVADPDQLPITHYAVDWGDGTKSTQAGLRLQSRPSMQNAITLVHTYSYADVVRCVSSGLCACLPQQPGDPANSCRIKPRVQITDNWGWCNGNNPGPPANPLTNGTGYYGSDCLTSLWNSTCTDDAVNGNFGSCRLSPTIQITE